MKPPNLARRARAVMFQGTGSDVGKSVLVAGLCRAYSKRGLKVLPFKPQNMSNNASVTSDGGEIGRAQALQAFACGAPPEVDMNPVLLKPMSETGAQIVVQGHVKHHVSALAYQDAKRHLLRPVLESFNRLTDKADLILVEGAGSASEINLRTHDIANMGFATSANVPVVMVGDIDRGGVIASLVGTESVLPEEDTARIIGFIINKMRGDARLFENGLDVITSRTGWPSLGVVPFFPALRDLPAEDSLALHVYPRRGAADILVLVLPHIANFDDLDPLLGEPDLDLRFVRVDTAAPTTIRAHVVILPGSKSVMHDLKILRHFGWDGALQRHAAQGGHVWGLCGGYQMLGRAIFDPDGVESSTTHMLGLGLLDIETVLQQGKTLLHTHGAVLDAAGQECGQFEGYEIHCGHTQRLLPLKPLTRNIKIENEGAQSCDGRILGTYIHGIFNQASARDSFLKRINCRATRPNWHTVVDEILDGFAAHLEQHVALEKLLARAN